MTAATPLSQSGLLSVNLLLHLTHVGIDCQGGPMSLIRALFFIPLLFACTKPSTDHVRFDPAMAKRDAEVAFEKAGFHQISGRLNGNLYSGSHLVEQHIVFCVHRNSNTQIKEKAVDLSTDEAAKRYIEIYNSVQLNLRAQELGC